MKKKEASELLGNDCAGLITKIEEELCTIEGREGKEAKHSSGRSDGVAYCWKMRWVKPQLNTSDQLQYPGLGESRLGG